MNWRLLRWSRWRTGSKVFTVIWGSLIVAAALGNQWTAVFYYTFFFLYSVIFAAQDTLIDEQRETIRELKEWWR